MKRAILYFPVLFLLSCGSSQSTEEAPAQAGPVAAVPSEDTIASPAAIDIEEDLEEYYFPDELLRPGITYRYRASGSETGYVFLSMRKYDDKGKTYLLTEDYTMIFPNPLERMEIIKEQLGAEGSDMIEFIDVQHFDGSSHQVKATLEGNRIYSYKTTTGDTLKWTYISPSAQFPGSKLINTKKRVCTGEKGIFKFKGKEYPTIKFNEEYVAKLINAEGVNTSSLTFIYDVYFAKGLGMVMKEGISPDLGGKYKHELIDVLSVRQWAQKKIIEHAVD